MLMKVFLRLLACISTLSIVKAMTPRDVANYLTNEFETKYVEVMQSVLIKNGDFFYYRDHFRSVVYDELRTVKSDDRKNLADYALKLVCSRHFMNKKNAQIYAAYFLKGLKNVPSENRENLVKSCWSLIIFFDHPLWICWLLGLLNKVGPNAHSIVQACLDQNIDDTRILHAAKVIRAEVDSVLTDRRENK